MGKILSDATAARVQELVRARGFPPVGPHEKGGTHGRVPVLVRCTSATAAGGTEVGHDQCYPAVVVNINSLVDEQEDGAAVWLTVLTNDTDVGVPAEGKVYYGLFAGMFDPFPESEDDTDPRLRVFAVQAGGGHCGFAALKPTDCLEATNSFDDSTIWIPNSAAGVWTSDGDVAYPLGSGPLVFTYANGEITVTLDALELISCGDGCWTGGPLTGHADDTEGAEACDGETFTICLECHCCPFEGYDGPGWYCLEVDAVCTPVEIVGDGDECEEWVYCSGPFETEEEAVCGEVVACCAEAIPTQLQMQVTSAECSAANFNVTLTYSETPVPGWYGSTTFQGVTAEFVVFCDTGSEEFRITSTCTDGDCGPYSQTRGMVIVDCDPVNLTYAGTIASGGTSVFNESCASDGDCFGFTGDCGAADLISIAVVPMP